MPKCCISDVRSILRVYFPGKFLPLYGRLWDLRGFAAIPNGEIVIESIDHVLRK